jgi:hypothetical protein
LIFSHKANSSQLSRKSAKIALVSPVADTKIIPSEFRWTNLGEDIEYKIELYDIELLWL